MSITIFNGGLAADDRGSLRFVNSFDFSQFGIKRMYQIENNDKCEFRAWHGHMIENKFFYCASGSVKVAAAPLIRDAAGNISMVRDTSKFHVVTLSGLQPRVLHIKDGMANGFRVLEPNTKIIVFSDLTLDEAKFDDFRFEFLEKDFFDIEVR